MKSVPLAAIGFFCCLISYSQKVYWACKVDKVSSEQLGNATPYRALQRDQFSATQAIGEPNVYPAYGINPSTWVSGGKSGLQFIQLSFCEEVQARQIIVAETFHPGRLTKVYGIDGKGEFELVSLSQQQRLMDKSRVLNFFIDAGSRRISAVKLVYAIEDGEPIGIDAVGISASQVPYRIDIPLEGNLNKNARAVKLSSAINSEQRELNPVLIQGRKSLFFSRTSEQKSESGATNEEDIWVSSIGDDGIWREARHVDAQINTRGPNFVASAHARGDTTVVLLGNRYIGSKVVGGLSVCKLYNGQWIGPSAIDMRDFYNHGDRGNFFLSSNDSIILLAVLRNDSRGGRDLYVSFKEDSRWSSPVSLGDEINSVGDESTPFLSDDNSTLYFSSNGHRGAGRSDVFVSHRLDHSWTNWSAPRNLGGAVNSNLDDFGFTYYDGKVLFVRGDENNTDIMELDDPLFELKIDSIFVDVIAVSTQGKALPFCDVVVDETNHYKTDINGKVSLRLPGGVRPTITGQSIGYQQYASDTIATNGKRTLLALRFVPTETSVGLKSFNLALGTRIYFDFDRSDVRAEFYFFLDELAGELIATGRMIKVIGFADYVGSDEYNALLSKRRADAVRKMLISRGVAGGQILILGSGEQIGNTPTESRVVTFQLLP